MYEQRVNSKRLKLEYSLAIVLSKWKNVCCGIEQKKYA